MARGLGSTSPTHSLVAWHALFKFNECLALKERPSDFGLLHDLWLLVLFEYLALGSPFGRILHILQLVSHSAWLAVSKGTGRPWAMVEVSIKVVGHAH